MPTQRLPKGGNAAVTASWLVLAADWDAGLAQLDLSALLLRPTGQVSDDSDMVFYNQPVHPSGAVRYEPGLHGRSSINIVTNDVPAGVRNILVVASVDTGTFAAAAGLRLTVSDRQGSPQLEIHLTEAGPETVMVLGEVYRRGDAWRVRAVCQGYASGLAGLATEYGITVDDDAPVAPTPSAPPIRRADECAVCSAVLTRSVMRRLRRADPELCETCGRDADEALAAVQREVTYALADGVVEPGERADVDALLRKVPITKKTKAQLAVVEQRLQRGELLHSLQMGDLPRLAVPHLHLPSTQWAHHVEDQAVYTRHLARGPVQHRGRLVITNIGMTFVGSGHGFEIPYGKLVGTYVDARRQLVVETSTAKGEGRYTVAHPDHVAAVITGAVKVAKRLVTIPAYRVRDVRRIPQDVKVQVYQRDQGKCVACGAQEYLEYDHVIPWSKGGATSVENVQLLCRRCNLEKGAKL